VRSGVVLAESVWGTMKAELVMDTIMKAVRRWEIPEEYILQ
jgi:hypothetical protein